MRDVCRIDCSGSIYQDTGSGGSVYIAVFIYDAGRAAFRSGQWGAGGCGLYRIRFNWTSDFHSGRRTGIYFPAEFWIYHRICGCGVCEW